MTENMDMAPLFDKSLEAVPQALDKVLAAARPGAVFGEPIQAGEYTVITAAEVMSGGGFGTGFGTGGPSSGEAAAMGEGRGGGPGIGLGGGGGGGSSSRPVATISIGPDGVQIKPIVDATKLALAAVTAWGAMMVTLFNVRRAARR